jgi:hypothetical protein
MSKVQFFIKKKGRKKFSAVFFSQFLVSKTLDLDPDPDPILICPKSGSQRKLFAGSDLSRLIDIKIAT